METLSKSLRGTKINPLNKSRSLEGSDYDFQVNLYIEIDNAFVLKSGGTIETAINYVNALVTASNLVYEKEISTHLHVSYVVLTDLYESSNSVQEALILMVG
jgi:hypothetical protein